MKLAKSVAAFLVAAPLALFCVGCGQSATAGGSTSSATDEASQNTYTGTCRIITGKDLAEMDPEIDPAAFESEYEDTFAILEFDPPQKVYARFAGDPDSYRDDETDMLCLAIDGELNKEGDLASWKQYDGKEITVTIDPEKTMWPSDARLPIGRPHTNSATVK